MITVMSFDSESEDDEYKLKLMRQAESLHSAIVEFSEDTLRTLYKRNVIDGLNVDSLSKKELIDKIRDNFYRIMADYKIDL